LFAFAVQTFNKAFIVLDYTTNTKTYAQNCENKAKPKLQCNGKCQMVKKLQQEEKKDAENPERKAENKNEIVLSSRSFFITMHIFYAEENRSYAVLAAANVINFPRKIFHPPNC